MEEFNPMQVNAYTVKQLADYIESGKVTIEEIYSAGYAAINRPKLEEELKRRKQIVLEEEEAWEHARRMDTVDGYKRYLKKYDVLSEDGYRGKHLAEAKDAIAELEEELVELRRELFDEMRARPWIFKQDGMKLLFAGVKTEAQIEALREMDDIISRFLASGQKITHGELIEEGIIPPTISREALVSPDETLVQTNISDLGTFPDGKRTDVYFIGVPRSGKSSVLAGLLSYMDARGCAIYQPHYNDDKQDLVRRYYNGLIESTANGKFPVSTAMDSISFMKLQLLLNKRENDLTFVEIGGEAFRQAAESGLKGALAWQELGAGSCLKSKNRKVLFFILDYGFKNGINNVSTEMKQQQILHTILDVLSSDGEGDGGQVGCTLSKVDTVAIIVTKSDLMGTNDRELRFEIAAKYVNEKFASFITNLKKKSRQYGINRAINYEPYAIPFSLGQIKVGNTYLFDEKDSKAIVEFLSDATSSKNTSILGRIFGGD